MKKLMMTIAGAAALAFSVQAGTWFNTGISNYSAGTLTATAAGSAGTWSAVGADSLAELPATVVNDGEVSYIDVDADADAALLFTAAGAKNVAEGADDIELTSSVDFTPFTALPTVPTPTEAKAAVILCDGKFYGLKQDTENNTVNTWAEIGTLGEQTMPISVTVKAVQGAADGTITVDYTVGTCEKVTLTAVAASTFQCASLGGCGKLYSLGATSTDKLLTLTIPQDVLDAAHLEVLCVSNATQEIVAPYNTIAWGDNVTIYFKAAGKYVLTGDNTITIEEMKAGKTIAAADLEAVTTQDSNFENGTKYYLTLKEALDGAVDGDTVTMRRDVTGPGWYDDQTRFDKRFTTNGLTVDFGGYTYYFTQGGTYSNRDKGVLNVDCYTAQYALAGLADDKIKFQNGAFAVADEKTSDEGVTQFVRCFAKEIELCDITMDCAGMNGKTSGVQVCNGTMKITGSTTINAQGGEAIRLANHASDTYTLEGIEINTTGTINGDILLAGGQVTLTTPDAIPSSTVVYWGKSRFSVYSDDAMTGFEASTGVDLPQPESGTITCGRLYTTLSQAFAGAVDSDTIKLLTNVVVSARIDIDANKNLTLDANGKTVTIAKDTYTFVMGGTESALGTGTLTVTGNGTFAIKDGDEYANGIILWARFGNIVVENGTYTMKGSAEVAYACNGAKITINGGTFANTAEKVAPMGDVLNVENTCSVTDIQVYGGTFSSEPKDDSGAGTFVASGYAANKSGDNWVVEPMLKYYAEVFIDDETTASQTAYLGEGDHYYGKGVKVPASKSGVQTLGGKTYYVSKLVLKGGDQCTFTYDGTALTKASGNLDVTIAADGTTLSYEVTTGENACFAEIYLTEFKQRYYAEVYFGDATESSDVAYLGNSSTYYGKGETVTASKSGVQTFNEKTYYVSKLVLKGGDDCTFTYNGTALTKASGNLDVTIAADGTTLSYEVTTGDNACFAEIYLTEYQSGPAPADGNNSDVQKVDGEANTYKVEPTAGNTGMVAVQGAKSGDTFIIDDTSVTSIGVDATDGVTIKVMNSAKTIDIAKACKGWTGNVFSTELKSGTETAEVEVTGGKTANIPVQPTIGATVDNVTIDKPFSIGTSTTTTKVAGVPGLTYTLKRKDTWTGTMNAVATGTAGDDGVVTLTDTTATELSAFYIIVVTK